MTTKEAFTEQEWTLLQRALSESGNYLIAADPASKGDVTREARAISSFFADLNDKATRLGLDNELLEALLTDDASPRDMDPGALNFSAQELATWRRSTLDSIKAAIALLDAKATPVEAKDVKIKMYQLAATTAAASKEGSFLGMGGERLTDAEKAALKEVADTLEIDPAEAAESWDLPGQP
jgi:hypothetical protein